MNLSGDVAVALVTLGAIGLLILDLVLILHGIRTRAEQWATSVIGAITGFLAGMLVGSWLASIGFALLGIFMSTVFADVDRKPGAEDD